MLQTLHKKHLACILFALSVLLFSRTIRYESVWDDTRVHFNTSNQLKMNKDLSAFWKDRSGMYIPLTYSSWAIVKKIASPENFDPLPFHLLNVLTHSMNGVLLFYLLLLLFKNNTAAFWGSIIFLIHPLQVESVAWISEFRGMYSTFFSLLSLLFYFKELDKNTTEHATSFVRSKNYLLAFVFYTLALLAKPSGIILPFLILLLCWRYYSSTFKNTLKALWLWLIPAAVVIFLLLTKNQESDVSIIQRLLIAGYSLFFYIQKIILPYPLAACYGYTPAVVTSNSFTYVAALLSLALLIFIVFKRNEFRDLFTTILLIFICLLPVLGLIPFAYQAHSTVADRYAYMAVIGTAFLIPPIMNFVSGKPLLQSAFIVIPLLFFFLTIKQTPTWKNEFALWDHTLKFYNNSSTVYYDRGVQYSIKGDFTAAISDYSKALELQPDNLNALFNRANAFENTNNMDSAFQDYETYLTFDKKDGSVYYKRAVLFYKKGKLDAALDDLQRSEELGFPVNRKFKEAVLNAKFPK